MHDYRGKEGESARALYANLMEEIKRRTDLLSDLLGAEIRLPKIVAHEFCHLQLRLICELIALGCLVAHGDIPATRKGKMLHYYDPDDIIRDMEKLHPNFYPVAGRQVLEKGKLPEVIRVQSGFLTKEELPKLWARCGSALHIGNLKSILKQKPRTIDLDGVREWRQKIVTLLSHHQITLSDGKHAWFVLMETTRTRSVQVVLMRHLGPASQFQVL